MVSFITCKISLPFILSISLKWLSEASFLIPMELWSRSLRTLLHFNPSPPRISLPSSSSLSFQNSFLHSKPKTSISLKHSSSTRQIQLLHRQNSRRLVVSASSSVALGTEKDRLPADLNVTETEEPNSRVRSCISFLWNPLYSLWLQIHISLTAYFCVSLLLQVKLNVEVPSLVCEDCYKRVLAEFMKMAKVLLVCFLLLRYLISFNHFFGLKENVSYIFLAYIVPSVMLSVGGLIRSIFKC